MQIDAPSPPTTTAASIAANRNVHANLATLAVGQPALAARVADITLDGEWVLACDGAVSLLGADGRFANGCSVPRRSAEIRLRSFEPNGTTLCFLAPEHAADVRVAFSKMNEEQALIVVLPSLPSLRQLLAGGDFSAELHAGRLFFASGEAWTDDLRDIFTDHPGLPTPAQFVKLPTLAEETLAALVAEASPVFSEVLTDRAERITRLRNGSPRSRTRIRRIGVLAKSRFALWDDAGELLAAALLPGLPAVDVRRLSIDRPRSSGPVATAEFAAACDAIVMADCARSDFPGVLPLELPWATWVTTGRIPAVSAEGPHDVLLIADESFRAAAVAAGWPAGRIHLAEIPIHERSSAAAASDVWTVIADTTVIRLPEALDRFSSHRLLWEQLAFELDADPFAVANDAGAYLDAAAKRAGVDALELPRAAFISSLIVPTFQQSIVRRLAKAGIAVRAFGDQWDAVAVHGVDVCGPIHDRNAFAAALRSARQLLHVWPTRGPHPIDHVGRPVLRVPGSAKELIEAVHRPLPLPRLPKQPLDLGILLQSLGA